VGVRSIAWLDAGLHSVHAFIDNGRVFVPYFEDFLVEFDNWLANTLPSQLRKNMSLYVRHEITPLHAPSAGPEATLKTLTLDHKRVVRAVDNVDYHAVIAPKLPRANEALLRRKTFRADQWDEKQESGDNESGV
jgi:hypothetical protein